MEQHCLVCSPQQPGGLLCEKHKSMADSALEQEDIIAFCPYCGATPLEEEQFRRLFPEQTVRLPLQEHRFLVLIYGTSGCHLCQPNDAVCQRFTVIKGLLRDN